MEFNCEMLGITQEEMIDRVVEALSDKLLTDRRMFCDEYGNDGETSVSSSFAKRMEKIIADRIDARIEEIGNQYVIPRVDDMISGFVLQKTNNWGEKTGKSVTLTEYIVARAEEYASEKVDFNGRSESECRSYHTSFSPYTTRIPYLIDKHIGFAIERMSKEVLSRAFGVASDSLKSAVEVALKDAASKVKISATIK